MTSIHPLALFLIFSFLLGTNSIVDQSQSSTISNFSAVITTPAIPILVGEVVNPMLKINIRCASDESPGLVQLFEFSFSNPSDMVGLDALQIYYTGEDSIFSSADLYGELSELDVNPSLIIRGSTPLVTGSNYFWLSGGTNQKLEILNKLMVRCDSIQIDGAKILVEQTFKPQHVGIALRRHKDDGVHTYRIPGLVTTNQGTLIAVYDVRRNGSVDLQEDIDIGMSRSTDGGNSWAPMKIIADMGEWGGVSEAENGIGDPSILVDRNNGTIWVAGIWAHGHPGKRNWHASGPGLSPDSTSQFMLVKSEDDGITWSEPINITSQVKRTGWHLLLQGPGKGITLKDGTLVFPAQFKDDNEIPHATIIYSKDAGKNWNIGSGAKSNTTEAQVVELNDGSLMLNMRDDRGGARSIMTTLDLGKTWQEHSTSRSALQEPVCMASLIRHQHRNQSLLLFSNPADTEHRRNITIKISLDDGVTWPETHHILIDAGSGRGYSCLTSIDDETIGILYEGSRADLVFQKFTLKDLLGN